MCFLGWYYFTNLLLLFWVDIFLLLYLTYASQGILSSSTTRGNGGGGLFGMGRKSKAAPSLAPLAVHDGRPAPLEGWLEKKGHSKVHVGAMGENWQKRYLRIDESSTALIYTKSSEYGCHFRVIFFVLLALMCHYLYVVL